MNNKIKILFTTVVVSLCMFLSAVFSATPNKVNYQGVLKEKGQLVTGTRKMKFAIYDTPTGGNPKWTSGEVNVQVNGGAFRYVLEPTGINWGTGGPYYLELTVEGQVLSPREEVGSSIYALHAKDVDDGSITPSKLVSGQKYEIIAATATSVDWSNIKNIPAGFADGVDDTGGDNLGNHIATTTLMMGNYAIITSSSVVGVTRIEWADGTVQVSSPTIGTDNLGNHTATQNLNMANNDIVNVNKVNGYNITQQFSDIAASTNTLENTKLDKSSATITYLLKTEKAADSDKLDGKDSSEFQLTLSTPTWKAADADKLDGLDSTAFVQTTGGSMSGQLNLNNYALIISSSVVGVTRIEWADGTVQVSSPQAGGAGGADNLGNHTATQNLNMAGYNIVNISTITAQAEGIYLGTNVFVTQGNIGIGTTNPGAALEVAGKVKITGGNPGIGKVLTSDANGLASWQTLSASSDNLGDHTATMTITANYGINASSINISGTGVSGSNPLLSIAGSTMVVLNNGNVGIGTAGPGAKLEVQQAASDAYAVKVSSNDGTAMAVITNQGNVGIGTTGPTHKLRVEGGILATSSITANAGFYGDGSGITNVTASGIADNTITSAKIVDGTIVNADISGTAAIDWSKISKTGSSLADLATRSAGDLTTGNLDIARMPTGGNWGITSNLSVAGSTFVVTTSGNVGIGTTSPGAKLDVDTQTASGYIRASNFNPIPKEQWPYFDSTRLVYALWVGWDDTNKVWKYYRDTTNTYGLVDPGNPSSWTFNGTTIGYFDGDLDNLPTGTHINNKYNPKAMAYRCNQDDIQVKVGPIWMDKYAARIIDVGSNYSGNSLIDDPANGGGGDAASGNGQSVSPFWMAFSQKAQASTGMTWFVASAAAANAGKRLCTNAEWQMAASGTGRTSGNGVTNGDSWSSVNTTDLSRYGLVGMAGNVWEWVADWYVTGTNYTNSGSDGTTYDAWDGAASGYNNDYTWNVGGRAHTSYNGNGWTNGLPAAAIRGGGWDLGTEAGVFTFAVSNAPSSWSTGIGFRSCR